MCLFSTLPPRLGWLRCCTARDGPKLRSKGAQSVVCIRVDGVTCCFAVGRYLLSELLKFEDPKSRNHLLDVLQRKLLAVQSMVCGCSQLFPQC